VQTSASQQPSLPSGDWMFRLRGEVLGPVPSADIVAHMMTGDIDESTRISREEGEWRTIQQMAEWLPFLHQAKAHIRNMLARAEAERAARKRRMRNLINVGIGAVFLVLLSFALSYLIIVQRPWRDEEAIRAWAGKHVPLMAVAGLGPSAANDPGQQHETEGAYDNISIDEILIEDAPDLVAIKPSNGNRKKRRRRTTRPVDKPNPKQPETKPDQGTQVASLTGLSKQDITHKVYAKRNLNKLFACLKKEIARNEDLPGRVVLNFSIKNDGRIHNVQLDDIRLDNGPLHQCFKRKLAALSFPAYAGQVQNVTIPFDWKR